MRVQHMGRELPPVTASIGAATFPADGNNSEALMHDADEALYRAQNGGRTHVEQASEKVAVGGRISRLRRHTAGRCHRSTQSLPSGQVAVVPPAALAPQPVPDSPLELSET